MNNGFRAVDGGGEGHLVVRWVKERKVVVYCMKRCILVVL